MIRKKPWSCPTASRCSDSGELEQVASPREIYNHPATSYTAQFIGHTNLLRATFEAASHAAIALLAVSCRMGRRCFLCVRNAFGSLQTSRPAIAGQSSSEDSRVVAPVFSRSHRTAARAELTEESHTHRPPELAAAKCETIDLEFELPDRTPSRSANLREGN